MEQTGNGKSTHLSSWVFQRLKLFSKLSLGRSQTRVFLVMAGVAMLGSLTKDFSLFTFACYFATLELSDDILHPQHKQGRRRWEVGRQTKTT